jgi:hypothetical protein
VQTRDEGKVSHLSGALTGAGGHGGDDGDTSSEIVATEDPVPFVADTFCNKRHIQVGLCELY